MFWKRMPTQTRNFNQFSGIKARLPPNPISMRAGIGIHPKPDWLDTTRKPSQPARDPDIGSIVAATDHTQHVANRILR
jgi:hypothetical protein